MDIKITSIGENGVNLHPCDCSCSCPYCSSGSLPSPPFPRSLKRKLDQIAENDPDEVARVEIETEAAALRETLAKQQESIQTLCAELEEERAAASTAASEAMSMILRLQRDKAEAQMDARQFKLLSEERMSHDQQQIGVLEDLLFKRDEAVQSLSCELVAYRRRLLSCESADFKCVIENGGSVRRICDERSEFPSTADCSSCAVDAVNGADVSIQRGFLSRGDYGNGNVEEGEIRRLYTRLRALEADRESMREAIMAMGTDKAERILLKEIGRQLHKEAMPEKRIVKKSWYLRSFSVMSVFKWMASLFFWRKKSPRIKYPMGLSNQKAGLLVLLDRSQRKRLRRCLTRLPR